MKIHEFETIGTIFKISIWNENNESENKESEVENIFKIIKETCTQFDQKYSRFKKDSFIKNISKKIGIIEIDKEFFEILNIYKKLNVLTHGKINPLIGNSISDLGYDENYTLVKKENIRKTQNFNEVVNIFESDNKYFLELKDFCLFDFGALGKGYLIDKIFEILIENNFERFLVDGSGDIRYFSKNSEEIICGLEHPLDTKKVIGIFKINSGSLCASATNRRSWGEKTHHYLDPDTNTSPDNILATWVYAKDAKYADGISSALFFSSPEDLQELDFEYLIVNKNLQIKKSANFSAELF